MRPFLTSGFFSSFSWLHKDRFRGRSFDAQADGGDLFESRLELLKVFIQEYRETYRRFSIVKRDHGSPLCEWDVLLGFGFANAKIISVSQFMEEIEFRIKLWGLQEAEYLSKKRRIRRRRVMSLFALFLRKILNPHIDKGRASIRYFSKKPIRLPKLKSDLLVGLASCDFFVLFTLPKNQAAECSSQLIHSFCVRDWLSKELKNNHKVDYIDYNNDLGLV